MRSPEQCAFFQFACLEVLKKENLHLPTARDAYEQGALSLTRRPSSNADSISAKQHSQRFVLGFPGTFLLTVNFPCPEVTPDEKTKRMQLEGSLRTPRYITSTKKPLYRDRIGQ